MIKFKLFSLLVTVLVTGASGFIGSHLCESLLNEGKDVIGIDNFDPFYSRKIKENNLANCLPYTRFHFYEADVRSEDFALILSNNEIDQIVHLAARAGVRPSLNFPQSYVHHDVEATVNLLSNARRFEVRDIVFGSSSSVYGNLPDRPYKEDMNLSEPISPYAAAKLSCELFNHVFYSQYGLNISNLRFFTVYGPRQRPEMGIHKFVRLVHHDEQIQMYGDGTTSRDYTYVDDIINGIRLAMDKISGYNTYNLGNRDAITLSRLIEVVGEVVGKEPVVNQVEMQKGDVDHTLADISKAKKDLGYEPRISIKEGVTRFYDWYLTNKI